MPTAASIDLDRRTHKSGKSDNASAFDAIMDTALGGEAARSSYEDTMGTWNTDVLLGNSTEVLQVETVVKAPGGTVELSEDMLLAMLTLSERYSFRVSEISGGVHGANAFTSSRHFSGSAFDITDVAPLGEPLVPVNQATTGVWAQFANWGQFLGATEPLYPGKPGHDNHLHLGWDRSAPPRPTINLKLEVGKLIYKVDTSNMSYPEKQPPNYLP